MSLAGLKGLQGIAEHSDNAVNFLAMGVTIFLHIVMLGRRWVVLISRI